MMQSKIDTSMALLQQAEAEFAPQIVFACSFGAEDVVMLDLISRCARAITIVTLDTGRLPQQTYDVMDACRSRYGLPIEVYCPDAAEVEAMVREHGMNLFRDSVAKRKRCCELRKIHPLRRALAGRKAWVTGVRREQADSRQQMAPIEDDTGFGIKKFNPLIEWSEADVWAYIREHDVPYNALHDQHYPSIGCAPCTRAIAVGEDPRAGRWWWEQEDGIAECGLHASPLKHKS
ncbi:MAG: phosphoadenylyl-sulfate reductase [Zetaproteobacteria bacterium CG12_big_fil_rev_8_21_14_0_65_54_13]|nr:MAG: phosphoadenylyl-sulfate reductase [Zetaproteobacteria bacterium CG23_combo_of_CG06-09_8_20_14_all_54_7]PIW44195.1 MAG: phosphoadenylyl-sulfate reductase [Zetaproteobacteria bacterium CG12_big_fil_rev_8_21_14_0_65_54_13]PIX55266.1 MAG: phosphoadenylyl-sulfate reductase [Zetaproteobacteria bacterium CG_4_10_14_3_um_filter_54_28]PJA28653.1 MAG: phosphoadenylyl-sulfate reductase [Zetaproteobacteria bacterium CG_4_9_14_3_um_filter_54_145]